MAQHAVMMKCRTGTKRLHENPLRWEDEMHVITWTVHDDFDDAVTEMFRLWPDAHNRERISLWIAQR